MPPTYVGRPSHQLSAVANRATRHYHDFMTKRHDRCQSGRVAGVAPPLPTFGGEGLQAGVDLDDSADLLDLMHEGDVPR